MLINFKIFYTVAVCRLLSHRNLESTSVSMFLHHFSFASKEIVKVIWYFRIRNYENYQDLYPLHIIYIVFWKGSCHLCYIIDSHVLHESDFLGFSLIQMTLFANQVLCWIFIIIWNYYFFGDLVVQWFSCFDHFVV